MICYTDFRSVILILYTYLEKGGVGDEKDQYSSFYASWGEDGSADEGGWGSGCPDSLWARSGFNFALGDG
jgi:hypothetical protein